MPQSQTAVIDRYEFGLSSLTDGTSAGAAVFAVRDNWGGRVALRLENSIGENAATVSVQVSPDGTTWNATTAANNNEAVTSVSVPKRQYRDYDLLFRQGVDKFVRIIGTGNTRIEAQVRPAGILNIDDMRNAPSIPPVA